MTVSRNPDHEFGDYVAGLERELERALAALDEMECEITSLKKANADLMAELAEIKDRYEEY